jgi:hypothetical protein
LGTRGLIDSPEDFDFDFKQALAVSKVCSLGTTLTLASSQRIEHTMQSDAQGNRMAVASRSRRARSTASVVELSSRLKEDKFTCMHANAATIMHACTRLVGSSFRSTITPSTRNLQPQAMLKFVDPGRCISRYQQLPCDEVAPVLVRDRPSSTLISLDQALVGGSTVRPRTS